MVKPVEWGGKRRGGGGSPVLNMEFKRIDHIEANEINDVMFLIDHFIKDGSEYEAKIYHIYKEMVDNLSRGLVFSISENSRIHGLLSISVIEIHGWKRTAYVHFMSTNSRMISSGRSKMFIDFVIDEIRKNGIQDILFNTRRNEDAFIRFLPGEWKRDSVTLKLCA